MAENREEVGLVPLDLRLVSRLDRGEEEEALILGGREISLVFRSVEEWVFFSRFLEEEEVTERLELALR